MAFIIPPNTFLGVTKLHVFRIKILGTLGDALTLRGIGWFFSSSKRLG
jgi:hypothetical protein